MREIRRKARKRLNTEFTEDGTQRSQRQLGPRAEQEGGSSGGAAREAREEREVGRDAEMFGAPAAHFFHEGNEVAAGFSEGVGDFRRRIVGGFAANNAVLFELAKLRGEDFFGDAGEQVAKFCEALRLEGEVPKRENLPLAGHDV